MGKKIDAINEFMFETQNFFSNNTNDWKPTIFDLCKRDDQIKLISLIEKKQILKVVDDIEEQIAELYAINNPTKVYLEEFHLLLKNYFKSLKTQQDLVQYGKWVYYPWLFTLVHLLDKDDFIKVRSARNRNLITEEEQKKYYNATIGLAGLSVGSSVAQALILQGGAGYIKLADFDRLALSNMNRIKAGVDCLGEEKVKVTARQIFLMNPYNEVEIFTEGVNQENIESFFVGNKQLDLIIDEIDNLAIKYLLRVYAKKYKVPLLMGADNGDNAVVDVERYDIDDQLNFFHGRLGDISYEQLKNLDKFGIGRVITQHIGAENITNRMQESLLKMGKTIVSWPQLGGAAMINGSAIAYCARKVLNMQPVINNRAIISLDEKLMPDYFDSLEIKKRDEAAVQFKKKFGL